MRLRRRSVIRGAALAASSMLACGGSASARDQWTVWITTDAPVPQLVDRALVEVLDSNGDLACGDCRRQLGVPIDPLAWPFSFGIAKPAGAGDLRVRVRLYRANNAGVDGLPDGPTTLDLTSRLPAPLGNTDVRMALTAECLGMPSDTMAGSSCVGPERALIAEKTLELGKPDDAMRPGSWPRAAAVPCAQGTPGDMVCVPGGFLILGDARALATSSTDLTNNRNERYVTLSAFAIDRDEVTVGTVRTLLKSGRLSAAPMVRGGAADSVYATCTYLGPDDPSNDAFPVSCVTATAAASACQVLGKRLPTEAEWEWAAGNLGDETRYPWGDVGDPCDFAAVGLGGTPFDTTQSESTACRLRVGQPTRPRGLPTRPNDADVTLLGVRQLGGGLSEWVADRLASYASPCWNPERAFLLDPRCEDPALRVQAIRGSSWADAPGFVAVVGRQGITPLTQLPTIGFRCARSDGPSP